MAEAILSDIAVTVLGKLGSYAFHEIVLACGVKTDLRKLQSTLSLINAVLLDAEEQQGRNNQVKDWLSKLKDAVYDADDLLDDFEPEPLRRKESMRNQVHDFFTSSNPLAFRLKMGHRIKELRERLDAIAEDRKKFQFTTRDENNIRIENDRETHSFVPKMLVIGRDGEKEKIVELLLKMGENEENVVSIIPIVGIGGLGKTTLAQFVYNDPRVVRHFQLRMWVCVSENFVVKDIVRKITESATEDKFDKNFSLDELQKALRKTLDGKTYLLVLDDVWNEDNEKWVELKNLLVDSGRGSKIIVTTRSKIVARIMHTISSLELAWLGDDDCWSLFAQRAFEPGQEQKHANLVTIGKKIIKKCGGVPLAITTLGGLLRFKTEESEWLSVQNSEIWELDEYKNKNLLATLRLSYDHLPSYLKQCFAYCSLFPKDHKINRMKLVQLWMAQGFVRSSSQDKQLEDIGNEYFENLLWRSFFQDVEKDYYGNITCKMHDLIHDLAKSVAGKECTAVHVNDENNFSEEVRHLSLLSSFSDSWEPLIKAKKLRTILLPEDISPISGSTLATLCSSLRLLRVLNLHNLRIQNLPSSIGKLKHLRYLDLSLNPFRTLPNSITKLKKLQMLNLYDCKNLEELPKDFGKMISLRHLESGYLSSFSHFPSGFGQLSSLQTLRRFIVGKKGQEAHEKIRGCSLRELHGLNNLRGGLSIDIYNVGNLRNLRTAVDDAQESNFKEKQNLQVLKLQWEDRSYEDDDIYSKAVVDVFEGLQPHSNLKEFQIYGYKGDKFPLWMMDNLSLFQNLGKIVLKTCRKVEPLPPLGQLPVLESLHLSELNAIKYIVDANVSCKGNVDKVTARRREFPLLKDLTLYMLPRLKEWSRMVEVADDAGTSQATSEKQEKSLLLSLPCLSKLTIWNCSRLMSMPLHPSLEELKLDRCSQTLLQSMMIIQENITTMSSFYPLASLKSLNIIDCEGLVALPEGGIKGLTSLQSLLINSCYSLIYLFQGTKMVQLPALRSLEIYNCPRLEKWLSVVLATASDKTIAGVEQKRHLLSSLSFPCLSKLKISVCPLLMSLPLLPSLEELELEGCCQKLIQSIMVIEENLTSSSTAFACLKSFKIEFCWDLVAFPKEGLRNLTSLKCLKIMNCPKLVYLMEEDGTKGLATIQDLQIDEYPKSEMGEAMQGPTNLQKLELSYLPNLITLPQWLGNLKSLQYLSVYDCPNLSSLPDGMQHLTALVIRNCPKLLERCKRGIGEDWHKIDHVPNITIDSEDIQLKQH